MHISCQPSSPYYSKEALLYAPFLDGKIILFAQEVDEEAGVIRIFKHTIDDRGYPRVILEDGLPVYEDIHGVVVLKHVDELRLAAGLVKE